MKLEDKIKAILAEGSGVPGTDAILGTKQKDPSSFDLKDAPSKDSGASKTSKITAKYDKSTNQPGLDGGEVTKGAKPDEKAASETAKIKEKLVPGKMDKLKEDSFAAMFDGEELSEEYQLKAKAIFEAAVSEVAEAQVEALQEEYQLKLDEAVEEVKGELVEQIDGYLDYVVEQWMQDNAVALESGIKVEIVSSFMENLKAVFENHYIKVPESKVDVVEEQAAKIEALELQVQEAKAETEAALVESQILKAEAIIAEAQESLTSIEAEKLYSLAENVDFDTAEDFAAKVKSLKESFFSRKTKEASFSQDSTPAQIEESVQHSDVVAVLKALRQNSKLIRSSN